jgi:hypothetical protein
MLTVLAHGMQAFRDDPRTKWCARAQVARAMLNASQ